jgi:Tol biopolymer transport system component
MSSTGGSGGDYDFLKDGTFLYITGRGTSGGWPITWLNSNGKQEMLHSPRGVYVSPRFSPDGKRLAFAMQSAQGSDLWVKDIERDTPSRLTFLPGRSDSPVWTPDGKIIVFRSDNPAAPGLYAIRSDGSGEAQYLTAGKPLETPFSFMPDGKRLSFMKPGPDGNFQIFTASFEAAAGAIKLGKPDVFQPSSYAAIHPVFSPDGHWLAYSSNESGNFEVYVRPFPGPGGRWQISTGGGGYPLWSRGGRELVFQTLERHIMVSSYTANGESFSAGKPRLWADTILFSPGQYSNYDLAPDGKRFAIFPLAEEVSGEKPMTHVVFLLNFFDELRRRVPAGK